MTLNVTLSLVICTLDIYQQFHSNLTASFPPPPLSPLYKISQHYRSAIVTETGKVSPFSDTIKNIAHRLTVSQQQFAFFLYNSCYT
jgi:hypothetical protein